MNRTDRLQRLEIEGQRLSLRFPGLTVAFDPQGRGVVSGRINVSDEIRYTVLMILPAEYPNMEPVVFCKANEIPWKIHRHVYEKDGVACLCGRSETRVLWPWGSDLTDFVTNLVHPFFVGQFYYDTFGCWPPTGERSHGKAGVLETFMDLIPEVPDLSEIQIERFLRLLARKNTPKGHEFCPCGNGNHLRDCHRDLVKRLRSSVDPRHAGLDLKEAFGIPAKSR